MKKLNKAGIVVVVVLSLFGLFETQNQVFAQTVTVTECDSGSSLSYDQAVDTIASGELAINRNVDLTANNVTVVVINNTPCSLPVSVGSYKMFGPYSLSTQSQQVFFDGTSTVNVGPSSTQTLSVNLPTCAAQYDIFYGDVLHTLVDNQPYGNLLAGDQIRLGQYCVNPAIPIVATLTASSLCVVPGTNITFVANISGDNIASSTLEKDTNADGSYGEVISWGPGPRTSAFTSAESASYTGVYSIKLMVNGIERARKDVTVNISCAPVVVVPIVATLTTSSICVVPGTAINFALTVTGSGITSNTLEKDTNSDGSYGEVISFGALPTTTSFASSESSSYSGVYSLRSMVNGIERARKDVTVNNSCGPVVTPSTGTIRVIKVVVNDNGKTKVVSDFPLFVNGTPVVSGVTNTFTAPATYVVTETSDSNYTRIFGGDCSFIGVISLSANENKLCVIVNDDIAPIITIVGPAGAAGSNGTNGVNGTNGTIGATGLTGAAGTTGVTGAAGSNGAMGIAGLAGAAGINGTNGAVGATGASGVAGAAGSNGATGANGANGSNGAAGANGANGVNGVAGSNGTNGVNGTNGTIGATGLTGATGSVLGVTYTAANIPIFPRTGFGPLTKIIPLNVFMILIVIMLAGVAFITDRFRTRNT